MKEINYGLTCEENTNKSTIQPTTSPQWMTIKYKMKINNNK